MVAFPLSDLP